MKKPYVSLALTFLLATTLSSCSWGGSTTGNGSGSSTDGVQEGTVSDDSPNMSLQDRMDLARKRVALRSIIRKGDYYKVRNDAETAIKYYKDAHERIEKDPTIALKLADSYYDLKRFSDAYEYYKTLPVGDLDEKTKLRFIGSIMLDAKRNDRAAEVAKYPFETGTKEYYAIVDSCIAGPDGCADAISKSSSKDPRIVDLAGTLHDYEQMSADTAYRDALIAGKFYEQKSFLAAERIANAALQRRPDYRILLKLGGYSEYELGNYKEASALLERYYALEPKDIETAYMLGIVNYLKEDYSTSNLYFNAAVLNGYTPKTELERRLIYNYTLLGDARGAYKIFRYLLEESDVTSEDFEIAIYMALEGNEPSKAWIWSEKGLSKFPDDDRLMAFAGGLHRQNGDYEEAESLLRKALSIDARNPIALLELGRLFIDKKDYTLAQGYLRDAVDADSGGYFSEEAQKELDNLPSTASGSTDQSGSVSQTGTISP